MRIKASILPVTPEQGKAIREAMISIRCPICKQREDFTEKDCEECPTKRIADKMEGDNMT